MRSPLARRSDSLLQVDHQLGLHDHWKLILPNHINYDVQEDYVLQKSGKQSPRRISPSQNSLLSTGPEEVFQNQLQSAMRLKDDLSHVNRLLKVLTKR